MIGYTIHTHIAHSRHKTTFHTCESIRIHSLWSTNKRQKYNFSVFNENAKLEP